MRDASSIRTAAQSILDKAHRFYHDHRTDPAFSQTYGYFTHHPVAPLNRRRLIQILNSLEESSPAASGTVSHQPRRVLDVACGGGIITHAIAALGHRVIGVDLSASEIRVAKQFGQEAVLSGLFIQGDVLASDAWKNEVMNALGGPPQVVVLAYALHHLPDCERFMNALAVWLDPGATLIINEENPRSPLFRLKHFVRSLIQKDTESEHHRTFAQWSALLAKYGFRIRSCHGLDPLPGLGRIAPGLCWSLGFEAKRE